MTIPELPIACSGDISWVLYGKKTKKAIFRLVRKYFSVTFFQIKWYEVDFKSKNKKNIRKLYDSVN